MRILSPHAFGQSGKVPIPDELPGRFFVLEFDRENRSYVLTIDDAERSTFDLGSDVQQVRRVFRLRHFPVDRTDVLIDYAREFGAAQYIPRPGKHVQDEVIQLPPRLPPDTSAWSWKELEEENPHDWLPDLRPR